MKTAGTSAASFAQSRIAIYAIQSRSGGNTGVSALRATAFGRFAARLADRYCRWQRLGPRWMRTGRLLGSRRFALARLPRLAMALARRRRYAFSSQPSLEYGQVAALRTPARLAVSAPARAPDRAWEPLPLSARAFAMPGERLPGGARVPDGPRPLLSLGEVGRFWQSPSTQDRAAFDADLSLTARSSEPQGDATPALRTPSGRQTHGIARRSLFGLALARSALAAATQAARVSHIRRRFASVTAPFMAYAGLPVLAREVATSRGEAPPAGPGRSALTRRLGSTAATDTAVRRWALPANYDRRSEPGRPSVAGRQEAIDAQLLSATEHKRSGLAISALQASAFALVTKPIQSIVRFAARSASSVPPADQPVGRPLRSRLLEMPTAWLGRLVSAARSPWRSDRLSSPPALRRLLDRRLESKTQAAQLWLGERSTRQSGMPGEPRPGMQRLSSRVIGSPAIVGLRWLPRSGDAAIGGTERRDRPFELPWIGVRGAPHWPWIGSTQAGSIRQARPIFIPSAMPGVEIDFRTQTIGKKSSTGREARRPQNIKSAPGYRPDTALLLRPGGEQLRGRAPIGTRGAVDRLESRPVAAGLETTGLAGGAVSGEWRDELLRSSAAPARLDYAIRMKLAPFLGFDPWIARLHHGPAASRAARSLQAEAFAIGEDVFFGEGRFETRSSAGLGLLAHELTHVGQQARTPGRNLRFFTPQGGDAMEAEAQGVAAKVQAEAGRDSTLKGDVEQDTLLHQDAHVPRPSMPFAMPAPAPRAQTMPEPSQTASDQQEAGKQGPAARGADARAVAERVYDLMREEIRLARQRSGFSRAV